MPQAVTTHMEKRDTEPVLTPVVYFWEWLASTVRSDLKCSIQWEQSSELSACLQTCTPTIITHASVYSYKRLPNVDPDNPFLQALRMKSTVKGDQKVWIGGKLQADLTSPGFLPQTGEATLSHWSLSNTAGHLCALPYQLCISACADHDRFLPQCSRATRISRGKKSTERILLQPYPFSTLHA